MTVDDLVMELVHIMRRVMANDSKLWSQEQINAQQLALIKDDFDELIEKEADRERRTASPGS